MPKPKESSVTRKITSHAEPASAAKVERRPPQAQPESKAASQALPSAASPAELLEPAGGASPPKKAAKKAVKKKTAKKKKVAKVEGHAVEQPLAGTPRPRTNKFATPKRRP